MLDSIFGQPYYLFGGQGEAGLRGAPGRVLAQRQGALCRATGDGAVWISQLKRPATPEGSYFKLAAAEELGSQLRNVPEVPAPSSQVSHPVTFREIWYEEANEVGYLHFDFYNGAMSTRQCEALHQAYLAACARPTKVIVLMGGSDLWSNGSHLNTIEASEDPATESWCNINAMDDLVRETRSTGARSRTSASRSGARRNRW
ncbi:MAG: hypothetical protein NVSMB32_16350 [Actinomycetota bacterium]